MSTPRHGLNWDEDGVLRYYENGYRMRVGLIWVDGHYYYIKSDGTAVRNQTYWVSHNNGLMPSQDYTFNEYGWLTDPVTDEDFDAAMSTHDKVSETLYFDWVLDANNSTAVTYTYTYNGGSLIQMTGNGQTLSFAYDGAGKPMAVTWNGTTYLYLTNIQGDVIAILDTEGNIVVQYTYDAWGNILTTTGTLAETLGAINPLTYRGYVFDQETSLYYLQSRYYNPTIGRFINADALVSTGQGTLGNNMFAYCNNNPVVNADTEGASPYGVLSIEDYYVIHKQVQMEIVEAYGYAMEVYVYGFGKRGYLDLYDPETNTFYEVKSIGAALTAEIQMFRYENSVVKDKRFNGYHISESPSRGSERFSGSFYYGDYLIKYSTENGLITYTATPKPKRNSSFQTKPMRALMFVGGVAFACAVAFGMGTSLNIQYHK